MTDKLSLDELLELGKKVTEWEQNNPPFIPEITYEGTHQNITMSVSCTHNIPFGEIYYISASCAKIVLGYSTCKSYKVLNKPTGDKRIKEFYKFIDKKYDQQIEGKIKELEKKQKKLLEIGYDKLLEHVRQLITKE